MAASDPAKFVRAAECNSRGHTGKHAGGLEESDSARRCESLMPRLALRRMAAAISASERAATRPAKGRALEDFICAVFERVPGIEMTRRNALNAFETEELDVVM